LKKRTEREEKTKRKKKQEKKKEKEKKKNQHLDVVFQPRVAVFCLSIGLFSWCPVSYERSSRTLHPRDSAHTSPSLINDHCQPG
jgi:uncharacterized membrane protein (DUF106 family)